LRGSNARHSTGRSALSGRLFAYLPLALVLSLICACAPSVSLPGNTATGPSATACGDQGSQRRYVSAVSENRRYLLDQNGNPLLIRGDSPWSGMTDWSPGQAELYFENRQAHGSNASIISLIGSIDNGGPSDTGATFDGIQPFLNGDITEWNEDYWKRVDQIVSIACQHGNSLFLYPIDGWTYKKGAFAAATDDQAKQYGKMVAERLSEYPNVVWMTGGDYGPDMDSSATGSPNDHLFDSVIQGIRDAGTAASGRPFSIQLYDGSFSSQSPFWASRVDWNFVYSYSPTYAETLQAYRDESAGSPKPAIMGEANYEGENNTGGPDTTDETLRRQVLWALTSGSAGDFFGSSDWRFNPQWESRLDTPAVAQIQAIRNLIEKQRWWELEPDDQDPLVVAGRGDRIGTDVRTDVLDNDYVTASRTHDGSLALVYVPTARTIRIDTAKLLSPYTAVWVDPADAGGETVPASIDAQGSTTTPGDNSGGTSDWLLLITSP